MSAPRTLVIYGGRRRTIDLRSLALLGGAAGGVLLLAVLSALILTRGHGPLTEPDLQALLPGVDAAISARLGAPVGEPMVNANPTTFGLIYGEPRGTLTFSGRPARAACSALVAVDRRRSDSSALAWRIIAVHGCRAH